MQIDHHIHKLAQSLWDFHRMNHELENADAILVLCSYDKSVAERGAQLLLENLAPLLIFSGGLGTITSRMWREPEADLFAQIALDMGVPAEKILVENRSTNTGENINFTKQLLAEKNINPEKFILVQKPYMERRSYATFRKFWPEKKALVTSPQVSFEEYLAKYSSPELSSADVISIMVGDLQRIKVYPAKGYQIYQEIPVEVWTAYEQLVKAGFDQHLVE